MRVVMLAAGLGSRLWPLSTPEKPKQFQPLIDGESLLQYTYRHLEKIIPSKDLYIQTLQGLESHVYEQLPGIEVDHVLIVPEHRDTLAETLWAVNAVGGSEPILFKSVDQYVADADEFIASLKSNMEHYEEGPASSITLLGTEYQEYSANCGYFTVNDMQMVTSFIEKPSKDAVDVLLKKHTVYRSLFIYIASRDVLLGALKTIKTPWAEMGVQLLQAKPSQRMRLFLNMPTIDISSTLFESADNVKAANISYSQNFLDVGRYAALYELNQKDAHGNVTAGHVILGNDCRNNFIINRMPSPLVVMATNDSVVIHSEAGSLVSKLKDAGRIGEIYKSQLY